MQFEHLIQINDPENPLVEFLNRDQVWAGLLQRVEDATLFLPGLESCNIIERASTHILRELDFGATCIQDRVTLEALQWVRFEILPSDAHAGGSLTIRIEEPESHHLFLRFTYQTTFASSGNAEEQAYSEYIKSAYHQSDVDCVRIIRTLAAGGPLQ